MHSTHLKKIDAIQEKQKNESHSKAALSLHGWSDLRCSGGGCANQRRNSTSKEKTVFAIIPARTAMRKSRRKWLPNIWNTSLQLRCAQQIDYSKNHEKTQTITQYHFPKGNAWAPSGEKKGAAPIHESDSFRVLNRAP